MSGTLRCYLKKLRTIYLDKNVWLESLAILAAIFAIYFVTLFLTGIKISAITVNLRDYVLKNINFQISFLKHPSKILYNVYN